MTDLHWSAEEFEWVAQVRQVLLDLARACLGDSPIVPMPLAQKAVPIANHARGLLDRARQNGIVEASWPDYPALQWTEQVRALFLEVAELYLSDRPTVPENLSERTLGLSEVAQEILDSPEPSPVERAANSEPDSPASDAARETSGTKEATDAPADSTSIDVQMNELHRSLKQAWSDRPEADVREWQQLLTLLEVMQDIHARID
ncbi:MAG: hypothetical protein ACFB9N_06205 [Geitlerinemataceae cyanobacterium]